MLRLLEARVAVLEPGLQAGVSAGELVARFMARDHETFLQGSHLNRLTSKMQTGIEDAYPSDWIHKLLENNPQFVVNVLEQTTSDVEGRVRGTEGIYDYLEAAYRQLGAQLLERCRDMLRKCYGSMKVATREALQKTIQSSAQYSKIVENYCTYVAAIDEDPLYSLETLLLKHAPHSRNSYPHNYAASVIYSMLDNAVMEYKRKLYSGESSDVINELAAPIEWLKKLSNNSGDVLKENVKNRIICHSHLITEQKKMVTDFQSRIVKELQQCHGDMSKSPDEFSPPDQLEQTVMRFREAINSLRSIYGKPESASAAHRMPTPKIINLNLDF
mmetsp:Transcript_25660/g.81480  ORF Transcript_25660/g.81480 Transcript_25660/m.81480 type:complete len:330 (-) Transcript_25660:285-1274(-)